LIELLLFTQSPESRHSDLGAFIHALTGFRVTDALDLAHQELLWIGDEDRLLRKLNGMYNIFLCLDVPIPNLLGMNLSYTFDASCAGELEVNLRSSKSKAYCIGYRSLEND
jgi:hypothetical protein